MRLILRGKFLQQVFRVQSIVLSNLLASLLNTALHVRYKLGSHTPVDVSLRILDPQLLNLNAVLIFIHLLAEVRSALVVLVHGKVDLPVDRLLDTF